MKLTSQTNYAIRVLMYCCTKGRLATVPEIADFYDLPEKYLFKIVQQLSKKDYIEAIRGRRGGVRLARPAEEISLGNVVRDIEESFELAECFQEGEVKCPLVKTCGLNEALHKAIDAFFGALDSYTIADLTKRQHNINVLLELNEAKGMPLR